MPSCDVCPSVPLSVMVVYCVKTSYHILNFFSRSDSHTTLVFARKSNLMAISNGDPLTVADE